MDRIAQFLTGGGDVVKIIVASLILTVLRYYLIRRLIPFLVARSPKKLSARILSYYINSIFFMSIILVVVGLSNLDLELFKSFEEGVILFSDILLAFIFIQLIFLLYYLANQLFLKDSGEEETRDEHLPETEISGTDSFRYVLGVVAIKFLISIFDLDYVVYQTTQLTIRVNDILKILLIVLLAKFVTYFFIRVFLKRYYRRKKFNKGAQYSINQLVRYVIYVVLFLIGLESIGIGLKVIWGGLAALMVGIGFGLQRTFADFIAGIILLFERSIEVGNTVEIGKEKGVVKKVGLRTSRVLMRNERLLVVPNSKMVDNVFVNWNLEHDLNRFSINVGVAYNSDVKKVKEILLRIARENSYVETRPAPLVRFTDFGESALRFELLFWSRILIAIEDVQSDIRFQIMEAFDQEGVSIPFPQRDIWIKSDSGSTEE